VMVTEGEQVVVGDTNTQNEVAYEVLCRRHHEDDLPSVKALSLMGIIGYAWGWQPVAISMIEASIEIADYKSP